MELKAPSVENSRCSFGSLICFWETQENLSHLSRLLMNSYDLLAFTGFHRAGTTWVAENLFGHATTIFWICHREVLPIFSQVVWTNSRCWCLLKMFPVVLGSYWSIRSIPRDWTANHQIVFLWRKFPVEKFEIQQKFTGTSRFLHSQYQAL